MVVFLQIKSITYPDDYQLVDPVILLNISAQAMKDIIIAHNKKHTKRLSLDWIILDLHIEGAV